MAILVTALLIYRHFRRDQELDLADQNRVRAGLSRVDRWLRESPWIPAGILVWAFFYVAPMNSFGTPEAVAVGGGSPEAVWVIGERDGQVTAWRDRKLARIKVDRITSRHVCAYVSDDWKDLTLREIFLERVDIPECPPQQ